MREPLTPNEAAGLPSIASDLHAIAARAVFDFKVPTKAKSLYPALHAVAYAIEWPNQAEALGAVFRIVAGACGVKYGSEYMGRVIDARHRDGTLQSVLRGAIKDHHDQTK
jgi:hypothetical protein